MRVRVGLLKWCGRGMLAPMKPRISPSLFCPLLVAALVGLALLPPAPARAQDYVTDVYNRVNALRAQYGLAAYRLDPVLSAAAQAHSEWGASSGYFDHVQPDGSRPTDRAIRAGYGNAGEIRVSENIYWGSNATPESAVTWWTNSSIHFQGMTSAFYEDIGVGVAYGASGGYYTLMFGKHTDSGSGSSAPGNQPANAPAAPVDDVPEIPTVLLSTPDADGSVVHIVQEGQAIWNISAAYGVSLPDLLALNNLSDSAFIHPGDRINVRLPNTPVPTVPPTLTPWPTRPPITPIARFTGTPPAVAGIYGGNSLSGSSTSAAAIRMAPGTRRTVRGVLLGTLALGVGMILIGGAALRRGRWRKDIE